MRLWKKTLEGNMVSQVISQYNSTRSTVLDAVTDGHVRYQPPFGFISENT